jgi:hypothetical protein
MPRKKTIRKFEPRFGVSRVMIEAEAKYVARELADYLLLSLCELRETLTKRRENWMLADEGMKAIVRELPERERLAFQCMLFRDFFHILKLYSECAHAVPAEGPKGEPVPEGMPPTPFSEWLFGNV